jgi:hypothetical protein
MDLSTEYLACACRIRWFPAPGPLSEDLDLVRRLETPARRRS